MNKIIVGLMLSSLMVLNGYASESEAHSVEHHNESSFYIATKAMYTLGSSIEEEASTLEGGTGSGLGIDLGYRVGNGFSVEIDATYDIDNITEKKSNGEETSVDGTYITTSLDVAYTYHATHEIGLFVKGGFEYEFEKIDALGVDKLNSGFIYAAGTEYEMSETFALIGEYEVTTIKGPRGNSIFAGMVYSF